MGKAEAGTLIAVLEQRRVGVGTRSEQLWVRFDRGWISTITKDGSPVLGVRTLLATKRSDTTHARTHTRTLTHHFEYIYLRMRQLRQVHLFSCACGKCKYSPFMPRNRDGSPSTHSRHAGSLLTSGPCATDLAKGTKGQSRPTAGGASQLG
jgi:hypothetical protein